MSVYKSDGNKCPICGADLNDRQASIFNMVKYTDYECPNCGYFTAPISPFINPFSSMKMKGKGFNKDQLKSYIFYHPSKLQPILCDSEEYKYLIPNEREAKHYQVYNLTPEMVENWYPKTFAEKIDYILLRLNKDTDYDGAELCYNLQELQNICFVETKDIFSENDIIRQVDYILNYLNNANYISLTINKKFYNEENWYASLTITPEGLLKVYELQKKQENNKNVFVSMAFNDDTKETREAIRNGIIGAEYSPEFIDEIIHNHQIMPEMFRLIKESRFLILDITEPNFGAYYEAGYASGLGKEVIVCCKKEIFDKKNFICPHLEKIKEEDKDTLSKEDCKYYSKALRPHFDIAQKQTLVWEDCADLTKKLAEWIKFLFDKD